MRPLITAIEFQNLYWKEGLSTRQIGEILSVDHGTIMNRMKKYDIPRRPSNGEKLHVDLFPSPNLAYILGVQYGDGWISFNGKKYSIGLTAKDRDFVEQFSETVLRVKGGVKPSIYPNCGYLRTEAVSRSLYEFVRNRELHRAVIETHPADFIRGFADSEGDMTFGCFKHGEHRYLSGQVRLHNSSLDLLLYVKELLEKRFTIHPTIGVRAARTSVIRGKLCHFKKNVYTLRISRKVDIEKFHQHIGFSIQRKRTKLEECVKLWASK